jgi:integrase
MERFLSEQEFARLATSLDAEASASNNPYPSAAIKLLLLTGCRRSEILNLLWQEVDFEHQCLRLPDSKTGAKIVYLNGQRSIFSAVGITRSQTCSDNIAIRAFVC